MEAVRELTREVLVRTPTGSHQVTVRLTTPQKGGRKDPYCLVHFPEIMGDPIRVAGIDELAALSNAIGLLRRLVNEHKAIGWQVRWLSDGDDGGF
jgi:hypothetical protein